MKKSPSITIINGDLVKMAKARHFDVIVHGCNCFNTMGKGLALTIKHQFPEAYRADLATTKGDKKKLGGYSAAVINDLTVVNAYSQFYYGRLGADRTAPVDYNAIKTVLTAIRNDFPNARIGLPMIGAGLAGGDSDKIVDIITEVFKNGEPTQSVTLVQFKP